MNRKKIIIGVFFIIFIIMSSSVSSSIFHSEIKPVNTKLLDLEDNRKKDLLLEIISDIFENQEIQHLFEKSEIADVLENNELKEIALKLFLKYPGLLFPIIFTSSTLSKYLLNRANAIGINILKTSEVSEFKTNINAISISDPDLIDGISSLIENNQSLNKKVDQLMISNCDCEEQKESDIWPFPILCSILLIPCVITMVLWWVFRLDVLSIIFTIAYTIGEILGCSWA